MGNRKLRTVKIDSDAFLKDLHGHGYTRQSMGKKIGCTGRCIGQWMQRGEMPEHLYKDIMQVLQKDFVSPSDCGCDIDGDVFIYKGQKVWIDLQQYWMDGWNACKEAVMSAMKAGERK